MLGLLLGCGLRRSEVVGLNLDQMQSRDGRWVIVNLVGKEKRVRTVPVPSWSKELLNAGIFIIFIFSRQKVANWGPTS
jgi:integrase